MGPDPNGRRVSVTFSHVLTGEEVTVKDLLVPTTDVVECTEILDTTGALGACIISPRYVVRYILGTVINFDSWVLLLKDFPRVNVVPLGLLFPSMYTGSNPNPYIDKVNFMSAGSDIWMFYCPHNFIRAIRVDITTGTIRDRIEFTSYVRANKSIQFIPTISPSGFLAVCFEFEECRFLFYDGTKLKRVTLKVTENLHLSVHGYGNTTYLTFIDCSCRYNSRDILAPAIVLKIPTCIFMDLLMSNSISTTSKLFNITEKLCPNSVSLITSASAEGSQLAPWLNPKTPLFKDVNDADPDHNRIYCSPRTSLLDFERQRAIPVRSVLEGIHRVRTKSYERLAIPLHYYSRIGTVYIPSHSYTYLDLSEWT